MKILSIQPYNRNQKTQPNNTLQAAQTIKQANIPTKDTISFTGIKYPTQLLDDCIKFLDEMRYLTKSEEITLKKAEKAKEKAFSLCNQKMEPLLQDSNFLWEITPQKMKEPAYDFIIKATVQTGGDAHEQEFIWQHANKMMRESIINHESPKDLMENLKISPKNLKTDEHKSLFTQLETIITEKINIEKKANDNIENIRQNYKFAKEDAKRYAPMIDTNEGDPRTRKDFLQKVANRAIKKRPELKKVYSNFYKEHYNTLKSHPNPPKIGELKRASSDYASLMLQKYMMNAY